MAIYLGDEDLLAAHRAGDSDAFDELVRVYRPALFRHAMKRLHNEATSEDAVQEVLMRAYKALPRFSGEYRLGPWLHRIMANVCIDEANRQLRDTNKTERVAALPNLRTNSPSVEEELSLQIDTATLRDAMENLSDSYREALTMRFVNDMEYEEVAKVTGLSETNARARVSRARSAMRVAMKGIAVLPVFAWGLVRRGEKAAAATSVGGTVAGNAAASGVSTVVAASAPLASSILPAVAETTLVAAPIIVPVVAKAAVGIGIVAAVFAPAADSAVHQAVEQIGFDPLVATLIVDNETQSLGTPMETVVLVDVVNEELGTLATNAESLDAVERTPLAPETLSPSVPDNSEQMQSLAPSISKQPIALVALNSSDSYGGSFAVPMLKIVAAGGGRYSISGDIALVAEGLTTLGILDSSSRLMIAAEADLEGRRRIDALLLVELADFSQIEFRLAGMIDGDQGKRPLGGLFRSSSEDLNFVPKGSFLGSINLNFDSQFGSLEVMLNP